MDLEEKGCMDAVEEAGFMELVEEAASVIVWGVVHQ